ncbi:unnamed protein product [Rhizophagus irregularis]|nr:unnamed protein product [Rhizophagus irregularis]
MKPKTNVKPSRRPKLDSTLIESDSKNNSTAKLGPINSSGSYAICCNNNHGPQMGNLYCPNSRNWTYNPSGTYYSNVGIPANFLVECYEVFQVIKL